MVVQEAPVAVRITAQLEIITTPVKWVKWAFIPLQHPTIWGILITSKGTILSLKRYLMILLQFY